MIKEFGVEGDGSIALVASASMNIVHDYPVASAITSEDGCARVHGATQEEESSDLKGLDSVQDEVLALGRAHGAWPVDWQPLRADWMRQQCICRDEPLTHAHCANTLATI